MMFTKLFKSILIWIRATRAPFFSASIAPFLLGTSVAWYQMGIFHLNIFFLALAGLIFAHAGTNMLNDYFDHITRNDEVNRYVTPFSGGSRIIQDGIFSPKKVLLSSIAAFLTTVCIGLYLNYVLPGNILLWIGLIGITLGITYSAIPFKLSYHGIGELIVAIGFGPIVTMGAYFIQAQKLTWLPFFASIPIAILVGLILFINEFQDSEADGLVGKRTLVVKINDKKKAIIVYQVFLVLAFSSVILFTILSVFPKWTLIILFLTPWIFWVIKVSTKRYNKIYEFIPVNASTIGLHFMGALLLTIGFWLGRL